MPQSSSDADKGKALAQDPAPQTQVAPGTTVKVTVGTGLETVQVPDGLVGRVPGRGDGDADRREAAGGVRRTPTAPNRRIRSSRWIRPPGSRVQEGTPVTLTVSNNSLMVMPNLKNKSPERGGGRAAGSGLVR